MIEAGSLSLLVMGGFLKGVPPGDLEKCGYKVLCGNASLTLNFTQSFTYILESHQACKTSDTAQAH